MNRIRLATLLLPPAGLWFLWRQRQLPLWRRCLGTLFVLLYSILYASVIVVLLMRFTSLEVEWRGGFPPVLTFHKTKTDYAAVEAHRAQQPSEPAAPSVTVTGVYWTDFRGPKRDGHYAELPVLTMGLAGGARLLWKQPVGGGYASFVIADGRAFTIEQRRDREAVTAYDMATGRELWAHSYPAHFSESMGGDGPRATPTWHEGRIYSLGALGEFCCLEATNGRLLWRTNILDASRATGLYFGLSASPLIVDDKVIVLSGDPLPPVKGVTNHTVWACDKVTGALRWSACDEQMAYASPMLVTLAGQRQLLILSARHALGLQPENGAVLWSTPWQVPYDNSIAQPVLVGTNRFLLSGGYGTGCELIEVSRGDGGFHARSVWKNKNLKNKFSSSVFHEGFVYGLDEDILTCLDPADGRRRWKDGRYGYGQFLVAGGHFIVLTGEGELVLVKATPDKQTEVARWPALSGKTWNHPAMAGNCLLVRNAVEMACFAISP